MKNSFYSKSELDQIGFKSFGDNVLLSKYARIYSPETIEIGENVRIDDFCILSGAIRLGNHIHISAYTALYAKFGIEMEDYTGISPRCTIFSATDDFGGDFMVGPMVDNKYTNVHGGKVIIKRFSQIGSNCVILPALTIFEGVAVGAMSLVINDLKEWSIYKGIPAAYYKQRNKKMLDFDLNEY